MPANVETLAYNAGRGLPWHREGNAFETGQITTWDQMRDAAGLVWDLDVKAVFDETGAPVDGWQRITRDDTGATLHVARDSYVPITHEDMGPVFQSLYETGTKDGIDWDTAGSLNAGRKVFVTARLGDGYQVPGDPSPILTFLALLNAHDGSAALRAIQTDVRIVCANTWHAADLDARRHGFAFSFRHTSGWKDRLEEARQAIFRVRQQSEEVRADFAELAKVPFGDTAYQTLVERAVPITDDLTPRQVTAAENTRHTLSFVASEANPNLAEIRSTAYGAYQAVGEWLDHYRTWRADASADAYVNRTLLKSGGDKTSLLDLIRDIADDRDARKVNVAIGS